MNELDLIRRLQPYLSAAGGELVVGAGEDDAAAWREPDGSYTVATCDTSVEQVHFDLRRQDPVDVGWRALAFALGDLAAKGATPTYGLVSLSMPTGWSLETVEGIYRGLSELASEVGLKLVGGDTSRAGEGSLTLALLGRTDIRPLPRSVVRAGWWVAVTGPLGAASLLVRRPRPLLARGVELAAAGCCSGDVSDGLLRELDKFAMAAGVGARLELPLVPCAEGGVRPEEALASGEEVELVSCGQGPLPAGLYQVGHLTQDRRVIVVDSGGEEVEIKARGYDHFA